MARKQWLSVGELTHEGYLNKDGVLCLITDNSEKVLFATKAGTPPSSTAGYAVGCKFLNTSTGDIYYNRGSTTSCTFTIIPSGAAGSVTTAMLAANAVTPVKMGTRTVVALANSAATPTIAQLMTSSIFTMTPTAARTFTTPTAAVMVAGVSGATIGTWFDFTIVNLSASTNDYGITLTAGDAGVTLVGNVVVNSGSACFRAVLTNVTASSEALTIYRMEDAVPTSISGLTASVAELNILDNCTATYAELNYLDIAVLGTGAASKAVVLDSGEDYTWPATGVLTYGGTGITATGAEINYLDIAVLGTGAASKAVVLDGSGNYTWPAAGILTHSGRIFVNSTPVDYTHPVLSVGVYGTPVVDATLVDNIAFTVNMSTGTNKTAADTSCMAAYIGVSNTAATTNNKLQGLLSSATVPYNCFDAYAIQGHISVTDDMGTQNANAHITGISGKANIASTKTVATGWVTGGLFIVEGAGAVTQMCSVVSMVQEAGCSAAQTILYLNNDGTATKGIDYVGNFSTGIDMTPTTLTTGIAIDAGFTNGITITNAALGVTDSRALKVSTSQANAAMTDGYGVVEIDHTITGTAASAFSGCALSAWVNIPSGTVGAANYVCAQNNGVYEDAAATITNAKIVFGMRAQKILGDTDALSFPFSINTSNTAITAFVDVNNHSDLGWTTGVGSAGGGKIPFMRDVNGNILYVNTYTG